MSARVASTAAASIVLVLGLHSPTAARTSHQTVTVHDLQQGLEVVDGAQATLVRGPGGLSMNIQTSGLNGGHAYTVWWVTFDNPALCEHPMGLPGLRCGFLDVHAPEFGLEGDPDIGATIFFATGHVVGDNGVAGFSDHHTPGEGEPVIGRGVTNVQGAEIVLDVLDHGAKDPGNVPAQIHEFVTSQNACNPSCADHLLAGFPGS